VAGATVAGPGIIEEETLSVSNEPARSQGLHLPQRRDFFAGLMMIFFGLVMAVHGPSYSLGNLMHMGPGFLPTALGIILVWLGTLIQAPATYGLFVSRYGASGAALTFIVYGLLADVVFVFAMPGVYTAFIDVVGRLVTNTLAAAGYDAATLPLDLMGRFTANAFVFIVFGLSALVGGRGGAPVPDAPLEGDAADDGRILPPEPQWFAWACILASPIAFIIFGTIGGLAPATFMCVFVASIGDKNATWLGSFGLSCLITAFGVGLFHFVLQIPMQVLKFMSWSIL
jgi:hypothetical protein